MNAFTPTPGRFEAVLYQGREPAPSDREAWINSPTGKARKAIAKADRLTADLSRRIADIGTALTRGDGSEAAVIRMNAVLLDLRIACGDVESLARIVEASR